MSTTRSTLCLALTFAIFDMRPGIADQAVSAMTVKPLRSECLVQVAFQDIPASKGKNWTDLSGSIDRAFMKKGFPKLFPNVAQFALPPRGLAAQSSMYIQYSANCEQRITMTQDLMVYFESQISDFPAYKILPGIVKPNPETLDTCGIYWRDCN